MRFENQRTSMFRRLRDRKGMTTVEFALVGPAFFLVVFASIEFCRLSMIRNLTQDAAYLLLAAQWCLAQPLPKQLQKQTEFSGT